MKRLRTTPLVILLAFATSRAAAQYPALREVHRWATPELGLNLALGLGQGEFASFVKAAGGLGGYLAVPLDARGTVAIRGDFSILYHNYDTWVLYPVVTTKSYVSTLRFGPQLALGSGPLRLYGFVAGGFSYFSTDLGLDDGCSCGVSTTLNDDFTWATEVGGGMRIGMGGRRGTPLALDLGVRALRNGLATYVTSAGITHNSDGSFTVRPTRSEANLLVFTVGVSASLR
jgi:hypothetical protein